VGLTAFTAIAMIAVAGCGEKTGAANADAGEAALLSRSRDGGTEGGFGSAADAAPSEADLVLPPASNEELAQRMRHLLEAIAQDNADLAADMLFPRDAYISTRDSADPQKAWEKRVSGAFHRAVERTHKRNKGIEDAKLVGFELGHPVVQLTPKKHDFKRPLWRVRHSKLTFTTEGGKIRHLDIAEMTAWRGAWYITRLR
jgi:hypothetical protein